MTTNDALARLRAALDFAETVLTLQDNFRCADSPDGERRCESCLGCANWGAVQMVRAALADTAASDALTRERLVDTLYKRMGCWPNDAQKEADWAEGTVDAILAALGQEAGS